MINDDSKDGSKSSDGASGNDNWSDDLDRIPDSSPVSKVPDVFAATEEKVFEDHPRGDPRDHPVIIRIRLIVGAIGLLLFCAAAALSNNDRSVGEDGSAVEVTGFSLVQDLVCGLGIELLASVLMVTFYLWLKRNADVELFGVPNWMPPIFQGLLRHFAKPFRLVLFAGVLFCTVPLLLKDNFASAALESFGIEIFGAIIITTLLEDVTELVSKGTQDSP